MRTPTIVGCPVTNAPLLPMVDSFNEIPAFVAAAEAASFAAAARQLNLSRSSVGKTVARLEHRLGVRLFQRTTRRQSLTEDGHAFYESCQRALGELRAGRAMLESGHEAATGTLRVSMPVLFGRLCIAPTLTRLAARHPRLEIELDFDDRHVDLVEDGFDLAVRNGPLADGLNLKTRLLVRQRTLLYAAPDYLDRRGTPSSLDDLPDHAAVAYARSGRLHPWVFPTQDGSRREVVPRARMRFDDLDAVADAAVAGFGIAWLPEWLARTRIASGALIQTLAGVTPLNTDIYAVWPAAPYLPMRVRVAIDALVGEVPHAATFSVSIGDQN